MKEIDYYDFREKGEEAWDGSSVGAESPEAAVEAWAIENVLEDLAKHVRYLKYKPAVELTPADGRAYYVGPEHNRSELLTFRGLCYIQKDVATRREHHQFTKRMEAERLANSFQDQIARLNVTVERLRAEMVLRTVLAFVALSVATWIGWVLRGLL